jgi:hypothetical protein
MYASGEESREKDVARLVHDSDENVVERIVPGGLKGEEVVQVRWTTVREIFGSIEMPKTPSITATLGPRLWLQD